MMADQTIPLLRYVVVDDHEIDRLTIETEAAKYPFLVKLASCENALEASEFISRFQPDIIFADIEMPGMSGLDLVKNIEGQQTLPIFITSHPEFAVDGYEIEAFDYLLKPITSERFARCAFRIRDFYQMRARASAFERESESNYITIKEGYDKYKIPLHDILYLEAMKDYTKMVTSSSQYLVLGTLVGMQERLPPGKFTRIHRSYIVNHEKISAAKGNKIYISSHEIPIGKSYKNALTGIF